MGWERGLQVLRERWLWGGGYHPGGSCTAPLQSRRSAAAPMVPLPPALPRLRSQECWLIISAWLCQHMRGTGRAGLHRHMDRFRQRFRIASTVVSWRAHGSKHSQTPASAMLWYCHGECTPKIMGFMLILHRIIESHFHRIIFVMSQMFFIFFVINDCICQCLFTLLFLKNYKLQRKAWYEAPSFVLVTTMFDLQIESSCRVTTKKSYNIFASLFFTDHRIVES